MFFWYVTYKQAFKGFVEIPLINSESCGNGSHPKCIEACVSKGFLHSVKKKVSCINSAFHALKKLMMF